MKDWLVDVTLCGLNLERLMRQCAGQQVQLYAVKRRGRQLSAQVREAQLDVLCAIVSSGGWQLNIGKRHGLGRLLETLRRRWLLCAAGMLGLALVLMSSGVMWRIEIRDAGAYLGDIRSMLAAQGISAPMPKRGLSPAEIRDMLEYRYPRVAWVECGWRGSTLLITLHQGISAGETVSTAGCCDVVAKRGGVVESVVTMAGTPAVKAGDTVKAGQLLIRGEERGADESVHPVAARGIVTARVWDAAVVRIPADEVCTSYTGRETVRTMVGLPWFDLRQTSPMPYQQQDVSVRLTPLGGLFIPLVIRTERIREAELTRQMRNMDQLQAEAAALALQKLREKTGLHDKLIDKWVEYSTIEDGVLQAVAYGERLIEIGVRSDAP